jgi:glycosyltransferase involved in cell wall biosynthesis
VGALLYRLHYKYGIDQISRAFHTDRYDVFHSTFLPLPSKETTLDLPRVLTIYDLIFLNKPEYGTPELNELLNCVISSIDIERDWVACISEFTKQELCTYTGMQPDRVIVTPLAAGEWFKPIDNAELITEVRQRYGIPEGQYFLTVATLQPRKNLSHLISSFFKFIVENPTIPVNLVLVGTPSWEYEATFDAAESSHSLRSRVIFTGYIPNSALSAIYSGAKGFVFPSLYEGFGLPTLEAMQCGTPVIASNTTALPEIVGDAGLLVAPTDSDELCDAMLRLIEDDQLVERLRRKGLQRAKQFTWSSCADQTVALYAKALS